MKTRSLKLILLSLIAFGFTSTSSKTSRIETKANAALSYCKAQGLNAEFCVLIDMSIHSR